MEKFSTIFHWCEGLFPALIALAQRQRKRVSIGSCSGPLIREEIRFATIGAVPKKRNSERTTPSS
jgi:hypothetical protein